jgi:hypothetical protein
MEVPGVEPLSDPDDLTPADDTSDETEPEENPGTAGTRGRRIGWWW